MAAVGHFDYIATALKGAIQSTTPLAVKGRVSHVTGTIIRAVVPAVKIGEICVLRTPGDSFELQAEVVGFARDAPLNPASGAKKIFGIKNLVENLKSILKVVFLTILIILIIRDSIEASIKAPSCGLPCVEFVMGEMLKKMAIFTSVAFIVVAGFDYAFQKAQHLKSLKMTKDEVKREYKESEGDPLIKSKRRQLAQELVMSDQGAAVRKSSVVVTNPSRIAVALRYVRGETPLPMVVAKGENLNAQRIIKIAREEGIPVMANVPLARALFEEVDVDRYIPGELLEPVAEVLRWVQSLKARQEEDERLW